RYEVQCSGSRSSLVRPPVSFIAIRHFYPAPPPFHRLVMGKGFFRIIVITPLFKICNWVFPAKKGSGLRPACGSRNRLDRILRFSSLLKNSRELAECHSLRVHMRILPDTFRVLLQVSGTEVVCLSQLLPLNAGHSTGDDADIPGFWCH